MFVSWYIRTIRYIRKGKERKGYSELKEEALDRTAWRTGFGIVCGPVVRQTKE